MWSLVISRQGYHIQFETLLRVPRCSGNERESQSTVCYCTTVSTAKIYSKGGQLDGLREPQFRRQLGEEVKCTLVQALRLCTGRTAHRGSRGIALLFHDHGTRRG